jgi:hypothetical protein
MCFGLASEVDIERMHGVIVITGQFIILEVVNEAI